MLLGDGAGDSANLVMGKDALGIRGDFNQVALPRALVTYRAGMTYFHGGVSLQEALVPIISMRIQLPEKKSKPQFSVALHYRRGGKKITTRLPVLEVSISGQSNLFATEDKLGGVVNSSTRIVSLKPGETVQIILKMDTEFEGKFSVKALDPITSLELCKSLDLETDYTV